MGRRSEQKEKRRMEILSAALDLFITKGYTATKISDIADRVGMSVGLMFHYFESKEKLYEELIEIGVAGPALVLEIDAVDPLKFFEQAAGFILDSIKTQPFTAKMFVLMTQSLGNDAAPPSIKELLSQMNIMEQSAFIIQAGQQGGTIRAGNPLALSTTFWTAITGIAQHAALYPDIPLPETEWIVDLIKKKN